MINTTLCYPEKDGKYLMMHRIKKENDVNHDKWIGLGGKFEEGESPEDCILRETKEETNLLLKDVEVFTASDEFQLDRHYVTIGVRSSSYEGELKIMEPNKIDEWKWFDINDLPNNIYTPSKNMIEEYKKRGNIK